MATSTRGNIRIEGLEHLQEMLSNGRLLRPEWAALMRKATDHMEDVAKGRAPAGATGKLGGSFKVSISPEAIPLMGTIQNLARSTRMAPYAKMLDAGSRKGTPYRMAASGARYKSGSRKGQLRSGKLTRGWLSRVVKLAGVRHHIEGLIRDVANSVERKWAK